MFYQKICGNNLIFKSFLTSVLFKLFKKWWLLERVPLITSWVEQTRFWSVSLLWIVFWTNVMTGRLFKILPDSLWAMGAFDESVIQVMGLWIFVIRFSGESTPNVPITLHLLILDKMNCLCLICQSISLNIWSKFIHSHKALPLQ